MKTETLPEAMMLWSAVNPHTFLASPYGQFLVGGSGALYKRQAAPSTCWRKQLRPFFSSPNEWVTTFTCPNRPPSLMRPKRM